MTKMRLAFTLAATIAGVASAEAQVYPTPKEGDWIARDFRFHTGEVTPELRIHYTTVGEPSGQPVLILARHHSVRGRAAVARLCG